MYRGSISFVSIIAQNTENLIPIREGLQIDECFFKGTDFIQSPYVGFYNIDQRRPS